MKRKIWMLPVLLLAIICSAAAADVAIDEKFFGKKWFGSLIQTGTVF